MVELDQQIKNRQLYNRKIANIILNEIEKHPQLRFIQILWSLHIVDHEDRFYEESTDTLARIEGQLNEQIKKSN